MQHTRIERQRCLRLQGCLHDRSGRKEGRLFGRRPIPAFCSRRVNTDGSGSATRVHAPRVEYVDGCRRASQAGMTCTASFS